MLAVKFLAVAWTCYWGSSIVARAPRNHQAIPWQQLAFFGLGAATWAVI